MNYRPTNTQTHSAGQSVRVTVVGNTNLSPNAHSFLSLGPSFSPAQNINAFTFRKIVGSLHKLRDLLRYKHSRDNRLQAISSNQGVLPTLPFPRSFYKEPNPTPEVEVKMRILSTSVLAALNQHRRLRHTNMTHEQWQGFRELCELRSNGTIRISVSDKGGEFVVMPQSLDRAITELHLRDSSVYRRASLILITLQTSQPCMDGCGKICRS